MLYLILFSFSDIEYFISNTKCLFNLLTMDKVSKAFEEHKQIEFNITNSRRSYAGYTVYRIDLKVSTSIIIFYFFKEYGDYGI